MVRHYRREPVCSRSPQARWGPEVRPELREVENSGSCLARACPRWPVPVLRQAHHRLAEGFQRGHPSGATGTTGGPAGDFERDPLGYCVPGSVQNRCRSAARFPPVHGLAAQRQPPRRRAPFLQDEHQDQERGSPTSPSGRAGLVSTCSCLPLHASRLQMCKPEHGHPAYGVPVFQCPGRCVSRSSFHSSVQSPKVELVLMFPSRDPRAKVDLNCSTARRAML